MLRSFLSDLSLIKDTLDKDGEHNFFGRHFSFFSAEPIMFYNSAKDVIVYVNNRFIEEFNYTVEDLAEWKYSIYPLLNSEDQEDFRNRMKMFSEVEDNHIIDGKYRLVTKNKTNNFYNVKIGNLYKGYYYIELKNSIKSAIPILKNKTADELINDAEAILKFGFWMWDIVTDKIFWTQGMYQLLEYNDVNSIRPTIGLWRDHILKDDGYIEFEKRFNDGKIKDAYRNKYQIKTNKDNILTVSEHSRIEYDESGKMTRLIGLIRDITLQEQSMKGLADYKAMIQENETFLNYGTWEIDVADRHMQWSDGMYGIFGYEEADKKNLAIDMDLYKRHMGEEHYYRLLKGMDELQKETDRNFYTWSYEIKDRAGATKILSTYAKLVRNNEKVLERVIGTTRDVTQLKEYEHSLETKISELNKSNRDLEEFAYIASHDLQEPLRKISTFGQRLQSRFQDELGEDGNMYVNRIRAASENMRNLIDNLLDFSRISRSKLYFEEVDLSAIVKRVVEDLDLTISETEAIINVGNLPVIQGVSGQMHQLFLNLLHNSLKFRKKEEKLVVDIQCRPLTAREKKTYQTDASPSKESFLITVGDNGIGFEKQYEERIFQVFQRLQGKSEYPGTGIGLSICKKIVNNHGGTIFASAEPGVGATFSIILPKVQ